MQFYNQLQEFIGKSLLSDFVLVYEILMQILYMSKIARKFYSRAIIISIEKIVLIATAIPLQLLLKHAISILNKKSNL